MALRLIALRPSPRDRGMTAFRRTREVTTGESALHSTSGKTKITKVQAKSERIKRRRSTPALFVIDVPIKDAENTEHFAKVPTQEHIQHQAPPTSITQNEFFLPGFGISPSVLQEDIKCFSGPDATVVPYTYGDRDGFLLRCSGPPLTKAQVEDIRASSRLYEEEQRQMEGARAAVRARAFKFDKARSKWIKG